MNFSSGGDRADSDGWGWTGPDGDGGATAGMTGLGDADPPGPAWDPTLWPPQIPGLMLPAPGVVPQGPPALPPAPSGQVVYGPPPSSTIIAGVSNAVTLGVGAIGVALLGYLLAKR